LAGGKPHLERVPKLLRPLATIAAVKRVLGIVLVVAISAAAAVGALRLTVPADNPADVRRQLAFLRHALDQGAGSDAQANFPEGYYFLYALYGLTEVQLGLGKPPTDRADEVREAKWALERLDGDEGRAPFDPGLKPAYGVFYRGWTNWLRGGVLSLAPDPAQTARFETDSAEIAAAFDGSDTPFLPAYAGQAWPVDSTVAIASLRLHDALLPGRYSATVARWLAGARQRLDPATGLLPHRADLATGAPLEGARGSSQSMILRFLVDIDPAFARAGRRAKRAPELVNLAGRSPGFPRPSPQSRAGRHTWPGRPDPARALAR